MAAVKVQLGTSGYVDATFPGFALDSTPSPPEEIVVPVGTFTIDEAQVGFDMTPDAGPCDVTVGCRVYDNSGTILDESEVVPGYDDDGPIIITAALVEVTVGLGGRAYLYASVDTPGKTLTVAAADGSLRFTYVVA